LSVALIVFTSKYAVAPGDVCGAEYRSDVRGVEIKSGSNELFEIEIAKTNQELTRGLSGRACIRPNRVMLFDFGFNGYHGIWMKDMNFPIDIVWLDDSKVVIKVLKEVEPSTYPTVYSPNRQARYVLELPSGTSSRLGISVSDRLFW
jgi:hypothetical protein